MEDVDLVRIECGTDRFAAHTLLARCQAEGLEVELLSYDASGTEAIAIREPFVLLVRADDVDSVRAIATGEPTGRRREQLDRARKRRTGR
ncbi:MAG: hypothetical protein OSA99_15660 [Acidimicrobiales bacterium]|nr:hypothetical protein [Acidimicrobiales bacterium]